MAECSPCLAGFEIFTTNIFYVLERHFSGINICGYRNETPTSPRGGGVSYDQVCKIVGHVLKKDVL